MKLLLDENLSPRLIAMITPAWPDSVHVRDVGLGAADDDTVWAYAGARGFTIVSKDADFRQRSFLLGPPPQVVWQRVGNRFTDALGALLLAHVEDLQAFNVDPAAALLILPLGAGAGRRG